VFWKKLSPPSTDLLSPDMTPPRVEVETRMLSLIHTMAPASAMKRSPASSVTVNCP